MVKFAKELPLPNENELSIDNAVYFITRTAKSVEPESLESNTENNN
jgi:hypothetical protein